jgi:hypothetical protein
MVLRADVVALTPDFDARVMQRVRAESRDVPGRGLWRWMTRARTVNVSPLATLALAAGLAGIMALAVQRGDVGVRQAAEARATALPSSSAGGERMMEFVFVNRSASSVAIVGDFNDWEEGGSPLRRVDSVITVGDVTT